jgi:hypothetical protein
MGYPDLAGKTLKSGQLSAKAVSFSGPEFA